MDYARLTLRRLVAAVSMSAAGTAGNDPRKKKAYGASSGDPETAQMREVNGKAAAGPQPYGEEDRVQNALAPQQAEPSAVPLEDDLEEHEGHRQQEVREEARRQLLQEVEAEQVRAHAAAVPAARRIASLVVEEQEDAEDNEDLEHLRGQADERAEGVVATEVVGHAKDK